MAWELDGENYVHPSAELTDVTLGENVQVLADATIEHATLSDSVVFPEAMNRDAELRRSLIDTGTQVESVNLSGAVIGAHTQLNRRIKTLINTVYYLRNT